MATALFSKQAAPLPQRLMTFFAKYPPKYYSAKLTGTTLTTKPIISEGVDNRIVNTKKFGGGPRYAQAQVYVEEADLPQEVKSRLSSSTYKNPFLPWCNPTTKRWRGPPIGLRRQAELVKLAKRYGVESLLPPGRKSTTFKEQRLLEKGLRIKGTGEGEQVKGHQWERRLPALLEKRRKAMENMPKMVRIWAQRGHGRGLKRYPSGKKGKGDPDLLLR